MNQNISLPSERVIDLNISEVENLTSEFVYNFFVPDESINDSGGVPASFLQRQTETLDSNFIAVSGRLLPRFMRLRWKPVSFRFGNNFNSFTNIKIKDNFSSIISEASFNTKDFIMEQYQDNQLDGKLNYLTTNILENKIKIYNSVIKTQIAQQQTNLNLRISSQSYLDKARLLNTLTPDSVSSDFIVQALNQIKYLGAHYISDDQKSSIIESSFKQIKNLKFPARFNKKIIDQIVLSSIEDVIGLYSDELKPTYNNSVAVAELAKKTATNNVLNPDDFEIDIPFISQRGINVLDFETQIYSLGFIVDKYEVSENPTNGVSSKRFVQSFTIDNPNANSFVDIKIKYGCRYEYTLRHVAAVEVLALSEDARQIVAATFLVASNDSLMTSTLATEEVPPKPPYDFLVSWNYDLDAPKISWSFPPTSQQDVKKFQVFRRATINEPFELIKEYDFDDSLLKYDDGEDPDPNVVEVLTSPKNSFVDFEYKKSEKVIYAVACIDAHGFTSNYTEQYEVWFDKFKNKLQKKLISKRNAPKQYPNIFLNADTFVDSMRDSNSETIKIYFMPEFLKVIDKSGADLNVLQTDKMNGKYVFQIINLDLQQSENIEIQLNDNRRT